MPLCKTGGGSFMILDLDPDKNCEEEVTNPTSIQFADFPVNVNTDNGNDCAKKIEDAIAAMHLQGKPVMIPICDDDCVTTGGSHGQYHIIRITSFYLDYLSYSNNSHNGACELTTSPTYGTDLVNIVGGNGSSSCMAGWFVRYVTRGPVGTGSINNGEAHRRSSSSADAARGWKAPRRRSRRFSRPGGESAQRMPVSYARSTVTVVPALTVAACGPGLPISPARVLGHDDVPAGGDLGKVPAVRVGGHAGHLGAGRVLDDDHGPGHRSRIAGRVGRHLLDRADGSRRGRPADPGPAGGRGARPRAVRHGPAVLGDTMHGAVGRDGVGPAVLVDAATRAVARADAHRTTKAPRPTPG